jgi:hypothetical protein
MSQTRLHLDLGPASCVLAAGRSLPEGHGDMINVGRLQPEMILISQKQKRIGFFLKNRKEDCVCISLKGDFTAETQHVLKTVQERAQALRADQWLTPTLKELAVKTGILSPFRYGAGVVPWSKTELKHITTVWLTLPRSIDSTPIAVDKEHGGRECPSAIKVWIRAVLDTLDQCLSLSGEIANIVTAYLHNSCLDYGCYALNQLQRLLRVSLRRQLLSGFFSVSTSKGWNCQVHGLRQ